MARSKSQTATVGVELGFDADYVLKPVVLCTVVASRSGLLALGTTPDECLWFSHLHTTGRAGKRGIILYGQGHVIETRTLMVPTTQFSSPTAKPTLCTEPYTVVRIRCQDGFVGWASIGSLIVVGQGVPIVRV